MQILCIVFLLVENKAEFLRTLDSNCNAITYKKTVTAHFRNRTRRPYWVGGQLAVAIHAERINQPIYFIIAYKIFMWRILDARILH